MNDSKQKPVCCRHGQTGNCIGCATERVQPGRVVVLIVELLDLYGKPVLAVVTLPVGQA